MLQEGKQILDLLVIQIHSAQLADPFRWGRSTQHYGPDIGWESLSERTKSPKAVMELHLILVLNTTWRSCKQKHL
jgi:hypothetical protein